MNSWMIFAIVISIIYVALLICIVIKYGGILKLNKCKYNLRRIIFVIEPVGDDEYVLNFHYGEKVLHSRKFNESDLISDKNLPFKEFVIWCEEKYGN